MINNIRHCTPFHISKWDEVKELFAGLENKANPNGQVFFISEQTKQKISNLIIEDIRKAFDPNTILDQGMVFCQPSKKIREHVIHVDGTEQDRSNYFKYALNIPILNCAQGEMVWYGGDYELELVDNKLDVGAGLGKYFNIKWNSEPVPIESKVLDTPHIVRIDVPHQVINHSDNYRIMLTTRFRPDIMFL